MAVSRQVPTPVHYRGDAASWMRGSHLTITSPTPMNAVAETHDVQMARGRLLVDGCSGGRGRGVGGVMVSLPVNGWSLAGAAGMGANLGSDRVASHHDMM